jgi:hypothetical protein
MPKLRPADVADIDVDELEEAEYSEGTFVSYSGEIAPADTILRAYIKNIWWTKSSSGNSMLKVLVIADANEGDLEEYNGMPMWENMVLTSPAKFKWGPFFEHFGISIRDVKVNKAGKSNVVVAAEDDSQGAPVEKIGTFVPGEDSDEAWCRVVTTREPYEGKMQAHVGVWLDYDEDEDEEEESDDEPDEDLEEEEPEEDEPEEEPEDTTPVRGRRTAAKASKPASASSPRTTARKPAPSRSASAKDKAPAPAKRGRGRAAAGSSVEPPF